MNDQISGNRKLSLQFILCIAASVMAVLLLVISLSSWVKLTREKNALVSEVNDMTARKEAIIAENNKLEKPQSHLKTKEKDAKLKTKDVEDTESQLNKSAKLRTEIEQLQQNLDDITAEIEALRAGSGTEESPDTD